MCVSSGMAFVCWGMKAAGWPLNLRKRAARMEPEGAWWHPENAGGAFNGKQLSPLQSAEPVASLQTLGVVGPEKGIVLTSL